MTQQSHTQPAIGIPPYGCGRCERRWGGVNTAHCGACHETFTTVANFDRHRSGSHSAGERHCLHPTEAGLVEADRPYLCWKSPTGTNPRAVTR